jgi:hypothetical protein
LVRFAATRLAEIHNEPSSFSGSVLVGEWWRILAIRDAYGLLLADAVQCTPRRVVGLGDTGCDKYRRSQQCPNKLRRGGSHDWHPFICERGTAEPLTFGDQVRLASRKAFLVHNYGMPI